MATDEETKLVGADRVLAVLTELAEHPQGASLDELAQSLHSSKSTVHRALTALRRAGLASQVSRGIYILGDEFLRLAFRNYAARPEAVRVEPVLRELARTYGETTHYAVLDGTDVVYRAKVDAPGGGVRLTSEIGGRNPAHRTAVGKLLLSYEISSERELERWIGGRALEARTPNSITSASELWAQLEAARKNGFAVDDQENEPGVNCVALPLGPELGSSPAGAISISALAFRTPLAELVAAVPQIRQTIEASANSWDSVH
ncbi:IclR family transcriptional regulator [Diaminobutyricibacter tongyongensis]|nr:IclR family transcriptional regulator [Diaminobutyricibacter tongyongensis]